VVSVSVVNTSFHFLHQKHIKGERNVKYKEIIKIEMHFPSVIKKH